MCIHSHVTQAYSNNPSLICCSLFVAALLPEYQSSGDLINDLLRCIREQPDFANTLVGQSMAVTLKAVLGRLTKGAWSQYPELLQRIMFAATATTPLSALLALRGSTATEEASLDPYKGLIALPSERTLRLYARTRPSSSVVLSLNVLYVVH